MPKEPWSQLVSCRDAADRPRDVKVLVLNADIVVVSPPGELAKLSVDESRLLRSALEDAEHQNEARQRA